MMEANCEKRTDHLKFLASMMAKSFGLPPLMVLSICQQESNWNPLAYRHEETYSYTHGDALTPTEKYGQMTSWGLMQVMGGTARWLGFNGTYLTELLVPDIGLYWGCKYLKKMLDINGGRELRAIAAYNAGSARFKEDGKTFVNQSYVDSVMRIWGSLEEREYHYV